MIAIAACLLGAQWQVAALRHGLQEKVAEITAANRTQYQTLFPENQRIVNVVAQMKQQLQKLEAQTPSSTPAAGFLPQLSFVTEHLNTENAGIQINQLRYQRQDGSLKLVVDGPSLESVQQLSGQLSNEQFRTSLLSAHQQQEGVSGVLEMRNR